MPEQLTEYEAQRLEHIKRNHEMLVRLGLVSDSPPKESAAAREPKAPRARVAALPPESLRRSARMRGDKPDYTKEVIDTFGDEFDLQAARGSKAKRARVRGAGGSDDDDDDDGDGARLEILESTTAFLRESRAALLRFVTSEDGEAPADDAGWRAEAVRRWGDLAGAAMPKGCKARDWEVYTRSRLSTPPPPSPHDLLQEYYAHDPWQLLCVCVLMSRVSSWDTKHRCISGFFGAYPTPSAFAQAVVERGQTSELRALINSLGLFDDRLRSLAAITTAFLAGEDRFEPGLLPAHKIHGVGQFGVHSFQIFARDEGVTLRPVDAALVTFCNWRRKHAAAAAAVAANPEEGVLSTPAEAAPAPKVVKEEPAPKAGPSARAERSAARGAKAS